MCKYCELEFIVETGEKLNNNMPIMTITDGSRVIDLSFNRYIDEENDVYHNELIIDNAVMLDNGAYTVNDKHIEIKYCPFCGEKL